MNDKNLYRGKRVDGKIYDGVWAFNGGWVVGDLIVSKDKYYIHPQGNSFQVDGVLSRLIVLHEVKSETVGQYTGLTDKNGKKIFEGDIVKVTTGIEGYKSTYCSTIQEVKYNAESGIAVFLPFDNSDMVEVEVIGNIYDKEKKYNGN